jgi:hypothetical protein
MSDVDSDVALDVLTPGILPPTVFLTPELDVCCALLAVECALSFSFFELDTVAFADGTVVTLLVVDSLVVGVTPTDGTLATEVG